MRKYEFSLILKGSPDLSEELADELYGVGCDDASPGTCGGVFTIDFHREAETLEAAINSAINDVRAAHQEVERVLIEVSAASQTA